MNLHFVFRHVGCRTNMIERRGSGNQKGSSGLERIDGILIVLGSHFPSTSVIEHDDALR